MLESKYMRKHHSLSDILLVLKSGSLLRPLVPFLHDFARAHFSEIAYAVADLCDNSIQATKEAMKDDEVRHNGAAECLESSFVVMTLSVSTFCQGFSRQLEVNLFLGQHSQKDKSYLVVWDNGCGMDAERIRAFATYFLGQEDRGLIPTDEECKLHQA